MPDVGGGLGGLPPILITLLKTYVAVINELVVSINAKKIGFISYFQIRKHNGRLCHHVAGPIIIDKYPTMNSTFQ